MSEESTFAVPSAEETFAALEQQLQRLKSAVSHLALSEAAATKAIEVAEHVLHEQQAVGRQVTSYVAQLPRLLPTEELLQKVNELTEHVAQQGQQLMQLERVLATPVPAAAAETASQTELLTILQTVQADQIKLADSLRTVGQTMRQGATHYPSKELAEYMQNLLEPLQPDVALAELITRQQHLLPEMQRQLTQLTASQASSQQELTRRLGEVTSRLQPEFGQLLHQVNASASALGALRKRLELGQPDAALTVITA